MTATPAPGPRPESIQQAINLFRHNLEHDQKPKERLVPVNAVYLELLLDYVEQRDAAAEAKGYQRGVEEVLALLNPRQHAIMTFDELRQQARALIPGISEVQR